jgi:hypothetical protein
MSQNFLACDRDQVLLMPVSLREWLPEDHLCADAGMVKVGVIAIDGTKVHANASQHSNRDYEQIAREILAEAAETDRVEDELYGDKRGDELPPQLATADGRGRSAVRSEWRLITATHNLLKLHKHQIAAAGA